MTTLAVYLNDGLSVINVRGPPMKVLQLVVFPNSISRRRRDIVSGRKCLMPVVNLERINRLRRLFPNRRGIPLYSSSPRLTA